MWVEVLIEVPRGGLVKRRMDGSVDFVSPIPCPYNYGHVLDTIGGDGDPVDVIVLGPRLARGHKGRHVARAALRFIDAGDIDDKVVCSSSPLTRPQRTALVMFFRLYVRAKRLLHRARGVRRPTQLHGWVKLDEALCETRFSTAAATSRGSKN